MMTSVENSDMLSLSRELNPLFNPVIMDTIFNFLPPRDLATCRVICRTWHDLALSIWRSSATLQIGYWDDESGGPYLANDTKRDGTSFRSLLDCWESDYSSKPFRQAHVVGWTLGENENMTRQADANRFWTVVGPHLTKLTLKSCHSETADGFFKIVTERCPNLETLCLSNSRFTGSREKYFERIAEGALGDYSVPAHGEHPNLKRLYLSYPFPSESHLNELISITYLELLSNFPHLTFIQLDSDNPNYEFRTILYALRILRAQKGLGNACPSLKLGTRLPVGFPMGREETQLFSEEIWKDNIHNLRVTLESLCVAGMRSVHPIKEAVTLNGPTLTTLIASMLHPLGERCKFPFGVQLDKLRLLTMSEDLCESFEFIKYTPNLEKLIIDYYSRSGKILPERLPGMSSLIANSPMSELANVRLLKLTTFKMQRMISENDLKCLFKWFPNVKELEMYLDNSQFAMVCENWPKLVHLEVYGDALTDEGVTGLKFPKGTPQSKKIPLANQLSNANIAFLRNLEVFLFSGAMLTELSVFHGFLKNDSLRQIFFGTQLSMNMLGERVKTELERKSIKTYDYTSHKVKYHLYDLRTALLHNSALHYWKLVKLRSHLDHRLIMVRILSPDSRRLLNTLYF